MMYLQMRTWVAADKKAAQQQTARQKAGQHMQRQPQTPWQGRCHGQQWWLPQQRRATAPVMHAANNSMAWLCLALHFVMLHTLCKCTNLLLLLLLAPCSSHHHSTT
jgi:hypothetical protein